jgi:hypothetical protein
MTTASPATPPGDGPPRGPVQGPGTEPGGWPLRDRIELGLISNSVGFAEDFARMVAAGWGLEPLAGDAGLVARELMRHAIRSLAGLPDAPAVTLLMYSDGRQLVIAAWDANPDQPPPGPDGRPDWGLDAAMGVTTRSQWRHDPGGNPPRPGKTVFFLLNGKDAGQ